MKKILLMGLMSVNLAVIVGLVFSALAPPSLVECNPENLGDSPWYTLQESYRIDLETQLLEEKSISASLYQRTWLGFSECVVVLEGPQYTQCWVMRSLRSCPISSIGDISPYLPGTIVYWSGAFATDTEGKFSSESVTEFYEVHYSPGWRLFE